ncbi:MAG: hypothetical protein N4A54_07610 [Peptostreptococcaceae bacterium]|jgi:hypothetical protein|nr:hypothetical protein [Peptostreptococcaceae bacterium]
MFIIEIEEDKLSFDNKNDLNEYLKNLYSKNYFKKLINIIDSKTKNKLELSFYNKDKSFLFFNPNDEILDMMVSFDKDNKKKDKSINLYEFEDVLVSRFKEFNLIDYEIALKIIDEFLDESKIDNYKYCFHIW